MKFPNALFLVILSIALLTSCQGNNHKLVEYVVNKTKVKAVQPVIIDLQSLTGIPKEQVAYVYQELSKIYPNVELKNPIPLPKPAYYPPRNRYRADSLINYLSPITPVGHVSIGITNNDISTTKDKYKDWGVMGLGLQPGNASVVSTFRLAKKNTSVQLFKLCIHELGHTQGLPHCPEKTCFMRDAEGKRPLDEEKEFCPKCKAHLISKGWNFDNTLSADIAKGKDGNKDDSEYFLCSLGTNTLSVRSKILSATELATANSNDEEAKGLLNKETLLGMIWQGYLMRKALVRLLIFGK